MKKSKDPQKEILKELKSIKREQNYQHQRICDLNESIDVLNYRKFRFKPLSMENQRVYLLILATASVVKYLLS
jgi:hypothetical protein